MNSYVLWTAAASSDPGRITREVARASESGKKIILVADRGAQIPDVLGGDREYAEARSRISPPDLVSLADSIRKQYKRGSF